MTPEQRAERLPGMQRNAILSAHVIGFVEFGAGPGHVPSFSRPDLVPGTADCLRCRKVIRLKEFIDGEACFVGPSSMCDAASGGA